MLRAGAGEGSQGVSHATAFVLGAPRAAIALCSAYVFLAVFLMFQNMSANSQHGSRYF